MMNMKVSVTKSLNGQYTLLGRFSNRWRDWDFHSNPENGGEIISSAAHQEFIAWLDKNPQHAPELWVWHTWGSAFKNRAYWWGWSGNFMYAAWELTPDEAIKVVEWQEELKSQGRDLGMSFGFYVLDYDFRNGIIEKYRAFEASILPLDRAANPWTSVLVNYKEEKMAFDKERIEALCKIHGPAFVEKLIKEDEEMAKALDAAGFDTKSFDDVSEQEVEARSESVSEGEDADVISEKAEGSVVETKNDGAVIEEHVVEDKKNDETLQSKEPKEAEKAEVDNFSDRRDEIVKALVEKMDAMRNGMEQDIIGALERMKQLYDGEIGSLRNTVESLQKALLTQQEIIEAFGKQIDAMRERVEAEEEAEKMAAAPAGLLAAFLAPKSIVGSEAAALDGRASLAKQAPAQATGNNFVKALFS